MLHFSILRQWECRFDRTRAVHARSQSRPAVRIDGRDEGGRLRPNWWHDGSACRWTSSDVSSLFLILKPEEGCFGRPRAVRACSRSCPAVRINGQDAGGRLRPNWWPNGSTELDPWMHRPVTSGPNSLCRLINGHGRSRARPRDGSQVSCE